MTTKDVAGRDDNGLQFHSPATSQATQIEQARVVAQVQARAIMAKRDPRDEAESVQRVRRACSHLALAEQAFFRFPRGKETITGPTVHLARELARCWGNIAYGIVELRQDRVGGESEMMVYAWDLETNAWNDQIFIVPHARETRTDGIVNLTSLRDVYENNTNNAARRLREAIFAVLPVYIVELGKATCSETLRKQDKGKDPAQVVAETVEFFRALGVTREQLEGKLERPARQWTEHDIAKLRVIYRSMKAGEINREQEFPNAAVTVAEVAQPATDAAKVQEDWPKTAKPGEAQK